MTKEGVLLICDRCGRAVMLERDKDNYIEDPPANWTEAFGHDLCDTCSRNLEGVMGKFWGERKRKEAHF